VTNPVPLQSGVYYHIYSRGNNRAAIFFEERNYAYFLKLYAHHVAPVADTFAYCLLGNHFHFLVRVRSDLTGLGGLSGLKGPSQHVSNLLNAYAKAINQAYQRTGALFQRPFGRIEVNSDAYFLQLVAYIHQNPQKHGLVADFRTWPYSSYRALLSNQPTRLARDEVLEWFGGAGQFEAFHAQSIGGPDVVALVPEDFD
jgi:putative transposase